MRSSTAERLRRTVAAVGGIARFAIPPIVAGAVGLLALGLGLAFPVFAGSIPPSDDTVLAVLPEPGGQKPPGQSAAWTPGGTSASDIDALAKFVRQQLAASARSGDPRYVGVAESALQSWPKKPLPDALRLVHAMLAQHQHHFSAALDELDALLENDPDSVEPRLLRAYVRLTVGQIAEAREDCGHLSLRASSPVIAACMGRVQGLGPGAANIVRPLEALLAHASLKTGDRRELALTVADIHQRLGQPNEAERYFREALQAAPDDPYLLGTYADLLLAQAEPRRASALLAGHEDHPALLLRRAIAERRSGGRDAAALDDRLAALFDAQRRRGDSLATREYARFALDLDDDPRAALEAALGNWAVQREPEDALLVARAAAAAGQPERAEPVLLWANNIGLVDVRLPLRSPTT